MTIDGAMEGFLEEVILLSLSKLEIRMLLSIHPQIQRATWHHLTVVRLGNDFVLYLDGHQLGSPLNIIMENMPTGNVRLGRRTNGRLVFRSSQQDGIGYADQFFGMIDDLAIYKRALNQSR